MAKWMTSRKRIIVERYQKLKQAVKPGTGGHYVSDSRIAMEFESWSNINKVFAAENKKLENGKIYMKRAKSLQ